MTVKRTVLWRTARKGIALASYVLIQLPVLITSPLYRRLCTVALEVLNTRVELLRAVDSCPESIARSSWTSSVLSSVLSFLYIELLLTF